MKIGEGVSDISLTKLFNKSKDLLKRSNKLQIKSAEQSSRLYVLYEHSDRIILHSQALMKDAKKNDDD